MERCGGAPVAVEIVSDCSSNSAARREVTGRDTCPCVGGQRRGQHRQFACSTQHLGLACVERIVGVLFEQIEQNAVGDVVPTRVCGTCLLFLEILRDGPLQQRDCGGVSLGEPDDEPVEEQVDRRGRIRMEAARAALTRRSPPPTRARRRRVGRRSWRPSAPRGRSSRASAGSNGRNRSAAAKQQRGCVASPPGGERDLGAQQIDSRTEQFVVGDR